MTHNPILPFKANTAHRHHIPKQKRKATNRAAYDAPLPDRGSLTVWFTDAAIAVLQASAENPRLILNSSVSVRS
jgi:hypothetical protein